jgi:hypothetical protein
MRLPWVLAMAMKWLPGCDALGCPVCGPTVEEC